MVSFNSQTPSVLVLGATGRTGIECIRALSDHRSRPSIHAFLRDSSKLSSEDCALCTSVIQGNALSAADLERALRESKATAVIVSLGNGDSVAKSSLRTDSALALAEILKKDAFKDVQPLIVSSLGVGSSKVKVGFGVGTFVTFMLRHVLKDHNGQEAAFLSSESLKHRTTIARATNLTDNKATGKLTIFGDHDKCPSLETDRADLAEWVANQAVRSPSTAQVVNVCQHKV